MTNDQLITLFKNVREIRGVLQIWNTQMTTVTFTKNIQNITGDPLDRGLSVMNNTKLTSLNISSLMNSNEKVEIQNNPNLNLQKMCSVIHDVFFNRRFISNNSFDCGCEINEPFKWPRVKMFPENCVVLYGNLKIQGNAPPFEVLYRLLTVTKIYGSLEFESTNLETLGFLQNLQDIESGEDAETTFRLDSNWYLRRLDLIKLQSIKSRNPDSDARFFQNDELCLDPAFVQLLARSSLRKIESNSGMEYCGLDKINNPSTYCTGKLSSMNDRCIRYLGNIIYTNGVGDYSENINATKIPQADIKKMQQLEFVFGGIYIHGTALTNFSLPNLEEIYQIAAVRTPTGDRLEPYYALVLRKNDYLTEVSFPNLKMVFRDLLLVANANLTTDNDLCRKIANSVRVHGAIGMNSVYDCRPYLPAVITDGS